MPIHRAIDVRTDGEKEADRKEFLLENYCPKCGSSVVFVKRDGVMQCGRCRNLWVLQAIANKT